jgi:hypothetical protein
MSEQAFEIADSDAADDDEILFCAPSHEFELVQAEATALAELGTRMWYTLMEL